MGPYLFHCRARRTVCAHTLPGRRATNTLLKERAMPGIATVGGKVFVFGGMDTTFKVGCWAGEYKDMSHCEAFDPATGVWAPMARMPLKCNSARAVPVGGKIFLMGGQLDVADDPHKFGAVQVYDPAKNKWRVLEQTMPAAGGACFAEGKCVIVLGGTGAGETGQVTLPSPAQLRSNNSKDDTDKPPRACALGLAFEFGAPDTDQSWSLDTTTDIWTPLAPAPKPHSGYTLYRDGEHIRAADDPSLNYNVCLDSWEDDPRRPPLPAHEWAAEILCAPLPF